MQQVSRDDKRAPRSLQTSKSAAVQADVNLTILMKQRRSHASQSSFNLLVQGKALPNKSAMHIIMHMMFCDLPQLTSKQTEKIVQ